MSSSSNGIALFSGKEGPTPSPDLIPLQGPRSSSNNLSVTGPFAGAFSPVAGNGYSSPLEIIFVNVIVVSDGRDLIVLQRNFSKQDTRGEVGANRKVPFGFSPSQS
jgi:hypothetical protein